MTPNAPFPGGDDTIVALATPAGRSAIAVLRLSGGGAHQLAGRIMSPWPLRARVATVCAIRDPATQELIDRSLVIAYDAPRSYTGEPVVEIMSHGGPLVPAAITALLVASGARPALPGEFTRRAVLNGKLDILQAEAIGDLIDARSGGMRRSALSQLDGGLSRRILALRELLLDIQTLLAYDIDFPEEDDGPVPHARILESCRQAHASLVALLRTAPAGELMREGALVVLAGAPNVGKSSLFNALLGRARAIVTDVPGTTRDALEAVMDGGEFPMRLVDTAGLRADADVVERLGIEVSERYLADADVVLACGDAPDPLHAAVTRIGALTDAPIVPVRTKGDLADHPSTRIPLPPAAVVVSAETGEGLAALTRCLGEVLARTYGESSGDVPVVTRARHRVALETAARELGDFERAWGEQQIPAAVAAVHIHAATAALEQLIGAVDVEDVLDRVFGTFCVGK